MTIQPLIGILCCNEAAERPIQAVATRFIEPIGRYARALPVLVPALPDAFDAASLAARLDGLLLTGSRSDVAPHRYGGACPGERLLDERRDEVALRLAGRMIDRGKPVFGICRGMQELNVLFGGSLTCGLGAAHHGGGDRYEDQFANRHAVALRAGGHLAGGPVDRHVEVTSVHKEGVAVLGADLEVEAEAVDDALIEAFAARTAPVLAVQWHPEWQVDRHRDGQRFFELFGGAIRGGKLASAHNQNRDAERRWRTPLDGRCDDAQGRRWPPQNPSGSLVGRLPPPSE